MSPRKGLPAGPRVRRTWTSPAILLPLIAIVGVTSGLLLSGARTNATQVACISVARKGKDTLEVTTTGLIHRNGSGYYVSCSEGTANRATATAVSCLTVTPRTSPPPYGDAYGTTYYHLSAGAGSIALRGTTSTSTEIIQPTGVFLTVTC